MGQHQVEQHSPLQRSQKRKRRERDRELTEEIIPPPKLRKETDIQVQESRRVPNKMNSKRFTPRYIITKMSKVKDIQRILKATQEKNKTK